MCIRPEMKPYEIIEHTADVGLKANGATLKELFENAAKGMFDIIGGNLVHSSQSTVDRKVVIKGKVDSFEELLVDWLGELLYIFNKQGIFFRDFKILELSNNQLISKSSGIKINPSRDTLQTEIKAVTFHGLKIEKDNSGIFSCNIIFDV